MISLESGLIYAALIVALLAALAVLVAALLKLRRYGDRLRGLEDRVTQGLDHYQGLSVGAVGQGQHLLKMEQDLARMRTRLDQLASSGDSNGAGFNQAIRMARKGCSAREIMDTCGLSQVEADLVVLLHKEEEGSA